MKRHIVCLCGSTRFMRAFQDANMRETLKGHIVLSVGMSSHGDCHPTPEEKVMLDELHIDKIDMADEVLVLNDIGDKCLTCDRFCYTNWCPDCSVPVVVGPYIGDSTRREIAHALKTGKLVRYLNTPRE